MEKTIVLGPRLQALADLIPKADRLIDVGCDHGYLPIYLLQQGRIVHAVAADIHKQPLEKAIFCAHKHGLEKKMTFVCTDGLQGIPLKYGDVISIAGMGETIQGILQRAPELQVLEIPLLLQPMTKITELVIWLYANGWHIANECLTQENGKIYRILLVNYGKVPMPPPAELLAGPALFRNREPLLPAYLDRLCIRLQRALAGLAQAEMPEKERQIKMEALLTALQERRASLQ